MFTCKPKQIDALQRAGAVADVATGRALWAPGATGALRNDRGLCNANCVEFLYQTTP